MKKIDCFFDNCHEVNYLVKGEREFKFTWRGIEPNWQVLTLADFSQVYICSKCTVEVSVLSVHTSPVIATA